MTWRKHLVIFVLIVASSCVHFGNDGDLLTDIAEIEKRLDARIGVIVSDQETGRTWERNSSDRFPMASTFKVLACGALLAKVDQKKERLERRTVIHESDLVTYSPVMKDRTGPPGVSLGEACYVTLKTSDNTAANIVLEAIGGPESLTTFLRSIGDKHTRLDRYEPDLNEAAIGDERDTTTPSAMAETLKALIVETEFLSSASQTLLQDWMMANQVGDALLRASIPATWEIADRTGAGGNGTRAIAAIIWPPERKPIIVAIYITETKASFAERNEAIAEIGKSIVEAVTQ